MKTLPNECAFATSCSGAERPQHDVYQPGLTKLEYFTIKTMEALINSRMTIADTKLLDHFAKLSVTAAKKLIEELNKEDK
jgi:hypothetical protein